MLSEKNSDSKCHILHDLYEMSKIGKFTGKEIGLVVAKDRGKEKIMTFLGQRVSFLNDESIPKLDNGDGCITL